MPRLAVLGMILLVGAAGPAAAQRPDLTGRWVLKTEAAVPTDSGTPAAEPAAIDSTVPAIDSSAPAVDSSAPAVDSAASAPDSAATGPASDLRPVLRRHGRPGEDGQLRRLIGMAQPVPAFRITQTEDAITFVNQDGFTYVVHPDGRRDSLQVGDDWIAMRARWRNRALEVEFRPPGGGRYIETYQLADSHSYLRLEVVIEHGLLAQRLWRPRMYRLDDAP